MKTESFNLSKNIITLLEKNGIIDATPIQEIIIPAILEGKDVLAQSETGSGKTISFAIPIIEQIVTKDELVALVLVPTRELCVQVTTEFIKFAQGKRLGITPVYGGVSIENQIKKLKKTNIIVATPGRLLDLIARKVMKLNKIKFLVFDEADRMLDMGFIKDIEKILKNLPKELQTMLFSATVSKEITELSKKYLYEPVHAILESTVDADFLHQTYYQTTPLQKMPLLMHLLKQERDLSLVFCNRKHITTKLADKLSKYGIQAKCLHGDMSQSQRERVTADFRSKRFNILIATDVAARGLHIADISHVYNYEIPKDVDSYTHRVGRTARAGKQGEAISLVTNGEEQKFFKQILFNYRGVITLKKVDTNALPKVEEQAIDKRSKGQFQHRDEQQPHRNEKQKEWSGEKSQRFGDHRKKSYGDNKPKVWGEEKSQNYNEHKKKSFDDNKPKVWGEEKSQNYNEHKKKSFGENKPKVWGKNKPDYFTKRKTQPGDESRSLVWREGSDGSFDKDKKPYSDDKSKFQRKNKPGFFGKKKSDSWEDRKPKFWTERKAKFGFKKNQ